MCDIHLGLKCPITHDTFVEASGLCNVYLSYVTYHMGRERERGRVIANATAARVYISDCWCNTPPRRLTAGEYLWRIHAILSRGAREEKGGVGFFDFVSGWADQSKQAAVAVHLMIYDRPPRCSGRLSLSFDRRRLMHARRFMSI